MVLARKILGAVCFATERGKGGPLNPNGKCTKMSQPVIDVLRSKHPVITVPDLDDPEMECMAAYPDEPSVSVPQYSQEEEIAKIAQ
jgi:hypothetical protein